MNSPHIELSRRFRDLKGSSSLESTAFESYTPTGRLNDGTLGWQEILNLPIAIILGEPGSGKTWEFREHAKKLRNEAKRVLFIRLDQLLTKSLRDLLDAEDMSVVQNWKQSDGRLTLFLDSVDEAKFTKPVDFFNALDTVRREIGDHSFDRLQVIISSRISEWQPASDASGVAHMFPLLCSIPVKKGDKGRESLEIKVVQIEPLDGERVATLAKSRLGAEATAFLNALDEHFAWDFARRPVDVIGLLNFWTRNGRLGSLGELIEFEIQEGLRESPEREVGDSLKPEVGRNGAQSLAAAVVFCRKFNFRVPDGSHLSPAPAMDVPACLGPLWSAKQCNALLSRALFDSPSYGHIRFHHRRIVEYLAAEWLTQRLKEGFALVDLEDLLFVRSRQGIFLRPSLAPVAAWLALSEETWGKQVRQLIIEADPSLFFRAGDASKLSSNYRRELMEAFCEKSRASGTIWTDVENDSLRRLADPSLSDYVSSIVRDESQPDHVREIMLRLIRHGRMHDCLDAVLDAIKASSSSDDVRIYAVAALRNLASPPQLKRLAAISATLSDIRPELAIHIATLLYPSTILPEELEALLRNVDPQIARSSTFSWYLIKHFEERLTPEASPSVLRVFLNLLETPPLNPDNPEQAAFSIRFGWVRKVVPSVLLRLFTKHALSPQEIESVYRAATFLKPWFRSDSRQEDIKAINLASTQHSELRQQLYWKQIEDTPRGNRPANYFDGFDYRLPFNSDVSDWKWVVSDIQNRQSAQQRLLALTYAMNLWGERGSPLSDLIVLYQHARNDASCRDLLYQYLKTWPKRVWWTFLRRTDLYKLGHAHWWQKLWNGFQEWRILKIGQYHLLRHLDKLRSGAAGGWLAQLVLHAFDEGSDGMCTVKRWSRLEKDFGRWITSATKEGCIHFWKENKPSLPHERKSSNAIPNGLFVGLTGINLTFERRASQLPNFTREEALVAARYAVNELNRFPPWLISLSRTNPAEVQEVLKECIVGEWNYPKALGFTHDVLARLRWDEDGIRLLVAEDLAVLLSGERPENVEIERLAYSILLREHPNFSERLADIVRPKLSSANSSAPEGFVLFQVSLQVCADVCLEALERLPVDSKVLEGLMEALDDVHDGAFQLVSKPDYARPENLYRLILLAYRHINPSNDVHHVGHFTPSSRDRAERVRTNLLSRLADMDDPPTGRLLEQLVNKPELSFHKAWLVELIRRREIRLSDLTPWEPTDIETFRAQHESEPRRDIDLFRIIGSRLRDLQNSVERSDNSLRDELQEGCKESELRRWVARKLQDKARGRYTVPQESVIDQEERPDIRVENPTAGHVSIEVKWANRWTLEELLDGLEKQLVGKYLRSHDSKCGIYLVGFIKEKTWKDPLTNQNLSFDQVVERLVNRARSQEEMCPGIFLKVVSIDFRPPNKRATILLPSP